MAVDIAALKFLLAGLGNWFTGWQLTVKAVTQAERLGYWGAAFPDHYMWGKQLGGDSTLDTWVMLTYLAARTKEIHLGTLVTPIPLRPPGILAKTVSTVDVVSGGRVFLGIGAGWSRIEFEGYSKWDKGSVRVSKTEEGVELILRLWKDKVVTFHGKHYRADKAVLEPKPVQKPHPPLLFGGLKAEMLRLAGRFADICYIPPISEMSFNAGKRIVLAEARRFSRENKVLFASGIWFDSVYNRKSYLEKVEEAYKNRCDYFVVPFERGRKFIYEMRDFARNVMPSFVDDPIRTE